MQEQQGFVPLTIFPLKRAHKPSFDLVAFLLVLGFVNTVLTQPWWYSEQNSLIQRDKENGSKGQGFSSFYPSRGRCDRSVLQKLHHNLKKRGGPAYFKTSG